MDLLKSSISDSYVEDADDSGASVGTGGSAVLPFFNG
jgi:hypothetical protein